MSDAIDPTPYATFQFVCDDAYFRNQAKEFEAAPLWPSIDVATGMHHRQARRSLVIGIACLLPLACVVAAFPQSRSGAPSLVVAIAALFCLSWFLDWLHLRQAANRVRSLQKDRQTQSLAMAYDKAFTVHVGPAGVRWIGPDWEHMSHWSHYFHVHDLPSFIVLRGNGRGDFLPKKSLEPPTTARDVFDLIRERLDELQMSEPHRLRRHFAKHAAPCPRCSYNLRGSAGDACPECGHRLSIDEFPRAAIA